MMRPYVTDADEVVIQLRPHAYAPMPAYTQADVHALMPHSQLEPVDVYIEYIADIIFTIMIFIMLTILTAYTYLLAVYGLNRVVVQWDLSSYATMTTMLGFTSPYIVLALIILNGAFFTYLVRKLMIRVGLIRRYDIETGWWMKNRIH